MGGHDRPAPRRTHPRTRAVSFPWRSAVTVRRWRPGRRTASCGCGRPRPASPAANPSRRGRRAVISVAFSGDGKTLATGGVDGKLRLWEATTGQPRGEPIPAEEGGEVIIGTDAGGVNSVAFSGDGKTLATGASTASCGCGRPRPASPAANSIQAYAAAVISVAISRDGKTLATGGAGRQAPAVGGRDRPAPRRTHPGTTQPLSGPWRSAGTAGRWRPGATTAGRWRRTARTASCGCGRPRPASPAAIPFRRTGTLSVPWRSAGTARRWRPGARTASCGCGRPRPASPAATQFGARRHSQFRGVQRGRQDAGDRGRRRQAAAVGGHDRPAPRRSHSGDAQGCSCPWRSAGTARRWRPGASTASCGCGRPRPASPAADPSRSSGDLNAWNFGGVRSVASAGTARRWRRGARTGSCGCGRPRPASPAATHPGSRGRCQFRGVQRGRQDAGDGGPRWQAAAVGGHDRPAPRRPNSGTSGRVLSVAFSRDGKTLATGGHDGKLRLWEATTGQPRGESTKEVKQGRDSSWRHPTVQGSETGTSNWRLATVCGTKPGGDLLSCKPAPTASQ